MKKTILLLLTLLISFMASQSYAQTSCKVMSFNIWLAGYGGDSLPQTITEIQNSGADIVGLQEVRSEAVLNTIATALGFYGDWNTGIVSRWPITNVQGFGYGKAATITTPSGQEIYMFNCHLTAYPYPPYSLPNIRKALREEKKTQWADLQPILQNMASYIATGKPVFFTGDFNVCSHLDYDNVAWICSTECLNSGLTDSWFQINGPPAGKKWPQVWNFDDDGITWTPKPEEEPNGKFDRIDFLYYAGNNVNCTASTTIGYHPEWPSDHRAVLSTFTIPEGSGGPVEPATVQLDQTAYTSGQTITVTFDNGPGNSTDWIGIYKSGDTPGGPASQCWLYTNGTQSAGSSGITAGTLAFDAQTASPTWPLPVGSYQCYFFSNNGYSILAGPFDFTITN